MSENDEKSRVHSAKHKNIVKDYVLTTAIFLAVSLVVTIAVIFATIKPVTALVHKVESATPMSIGDIEVKNTEEMSVFDNGNTEYGEYIANICCDEKGLNASVFRGLNRISARYGAGLSGNGCFFTEEGTAVAGGYDETYFASLKYVEKNDIITVLTADSKITYKVFDVYFDNTDLDLSSANSDLVVYSLFSDFSDNAGKCCYVFADKISEEGI